MNSRVFHFISFRDHGAGAGALPAMSSILPMARFDSRDYLVKKIKSVSWIMESSGSVS